MFATGGAAAVAQAQPADPLPVPFDFRVGIQAAAQPETPPPGANDWDCKPSPEHPRPVVLVNPTFTTQAFAWQAGAPFLKNNGYCVFTFNHGNITSWPGMPLQALGDIREAGRKLSDVVDRVLAETGAPQVDLVGHSQGGGILPDYYLKILGGAEKVHTKVGISPSPGTTLSQTIYIRTLIPVLGHVIYDTIGSIAPGLTQQAEGSSLDQEVYPDGTVPAPGVQNYSIITENDWAITPYTRQYYSGPDATNIFLQENCPEDKSEHVATMYSERSWLIVRNALDPDNAEPVPCMPVAPFWPGVS